MKCPNCGFENEDNVKDCRACGKILPISKIKAVGHTNGVVANFEELVSKAMPNIVAIHVTVYDSMKKTISTSAGSGYIVEGGFVVTNYHVIKGMIVQGPTATFESNIDSITYDLQVVAVKPEADIAVLRFKGLTDQVISKRQNLSIRLDPLHYGEEVYTIGNPRNLGISVNKGIVACPSRSVNYNGLHEAVQITVSLNHGNSGGALLDMQNRVVGMTTFGFSDSKSGTDMCVPAKEIYKVIEQIKEMEG